MTQANAEMVEDFLHELSGWEAAYPLSAFPEPDLKRAAELLKAGGMTLDAVSASNMRHVVACIAPKARAVIAAQSATTPQPDDVRGLVREALDEAMRRYPDDRAGLSWFSAASGLRAGEITQEVQDWAAARLTAPQGEQP